MLAVADEVVDSLTYGVGIEGKPDLILGAGDLPFEYLEILSTLCDAPCVFVPGNHDPDLHGYRRGRTGWTRGGLPTPDPGPAGAINADGRTVRVAGLTIPGLGGRRRPHGGADHDTRGPPPRRPASSPPSSPSPAPAGWGRPRSRRTGVSAAITGWWAGSIRCCWCTGTFIRSASTPTTTGSAPAPRR